MLGAVNSPHLELLAREMSERGHDVRVAGHTNPTQPASGLEADGIPVEASSAVAPRLGLHLPRHVRWLRKLVDRVRPEVVHAHWLSAFPFAAALARVRPLIATPWGSDVYLADWRGQIANRVAARRSDVLAVNSPDIAERVIRMGTRRERVVLIQWGVDLDLFSPVTEDRAELRGRLGLGPGPMVLSARGTKPIYNLRTVLDAFARVADSLPDAQLVVMHPARGQPALDGIPHADRVHLVGSVPHERMADYYRAADACVSIPSSDGSPRSVWEAMACACPCVLSGLPWLEGMVEPDTQALTVPIDAAAVASAVTRLLRDDRLAGLVGAGGRTLVRARHDRSAHMDRLSRLYRETAC